MSDDIGRSVSPEPPEMPYGPNPTLPDLQLGNVSIRSTSLEELDKWLDKEPADD